MGWLLLGLTIGWAAGCTFWYIQVEEDKYNKVAGGATIIFLLLFVVMAIVGLNAGVTSGALKSEPPTPTSLGR